MQKLLGSPMRTFGFNRPWAAFYAFGTLMLAIVEVSITFLHPEEGGAFYSIFIGALTLLCGYATARTVASSATIWENGISYKTLRTSGEMTWDEIERFRYSVVKTYHQGIIPTTEYKYILTGASGNKAELGSNLQSPRELGDLLWKRLHSLLLKKMEDRLKAGQTLKLGKVSVSAAAMELPGVFSKNTVAMKDVVGCALDKGQFIVTAVQDGKQKTFVALVSEVDNVFPLGAWITEQLQARAPLAAAARA